MENPQSIETLKKILKPQNRFFVLIISCLAFFLPLFFLPLTSSFFLLNKTILFYILISLLLLAWSIKVFADQKLELDRSPLSLAVAGFMFACLASTFIQDPNKINTLTQEAGRLLGLGLLYFLTANFLKTKKTLKIVLASLLASSALLALSTIAAGVGLFEAGGQSWLASRTFSPTGSPLVAVNLFLVLLPAAFYWAVKSQEPFTKGLLLITAGLQLLGLLIIGSFALERVFRISYLPPAFGWQIAAEGLKNLKTALLGVGPGNFLSAFSRFRPAGLNSTSVWQAKFTHNSNLYFHLLSTVGLLGLASYCLIIVQALKRKNFQDGLLSKTIYLILVISFASQFLISPGFLSLMVVFLTLGLLKASQNLNNSQTLKLQFKSAYLSWLLVLAGAGLSGLICWRSAKVWAADRYFQKSLQAVQENKGGLAYNFQVKAIKLNPYVEAYRVSYSNTNLALADTLASQKDLNDQKKRNIIQLISQAVREGKAAAALNPQISSYWLNLARVYQNIIPIVEDAQDWATAAYLQAVKTDPTNPVLRVNLGGFFYSLQEYDRAVEFFNQAANLKPDYANAYYNLAAAYQKQEDWQKAYLSLRQTLNLITEDNPNYQEVSKELENLEAKLPSPPPATQAAQPQKQPQLSRPSPLPSPKPGFGQIDLPGQPEPEIPNSSPFPSPLSSPEASPSGNN